MEWVLFKERKPPESGWYFWKVKSNFGGFEMYYKRDEQFSFFSDVPMKGDDEFDSLVWLDEKKQLCQQ